MKFLLWKITFEPSRLARLQWILFRLFKIKCGKHPCGHTKSSTGYFCHQPFDVKYCNVINEDKIHKLVCRCCGGTRIRSNHYINPNINNLGDLFNFDDE